MKIRNIEIDLKYAVKVLVSIALGTAFGLIVYVIFLYFNIAIFGWNLGLIFAPLGAGYVETVVANRLLGKDLGAISAFILFIDTTIYSFILKNPTLGMNLITAGSILVILQAAFPTLINYILLVIIGVLVSNIKSIAKNIVGLFKHTKDEITNTETPMPNLYFDENESNKKLNSLDFIFLTSPDMGHQKHDILGFYQSEIIIDNTIKIQLKDDEIEKGHLVIIKEGKDECLINLANKIKADGGNGVLDLYIQIGVIGLGGDSVHITSTGIGIKIIE